MKPSTIDLRILPQARSMDMKDGWVLKYRLGNQRYEKNVGNNKFQDVRAASGIAETHYGFKRG